MERCNPSPDCPLFPECKEDLHHPFWPRGIVKLLGRKAVEMNNALAKKGCRHIHNQFHAERPFYLPTYEQIEEFHDARKRT